MNCIFCKILRGESCARFVAQWNDAVAIVPLNPVVEGHVLVIPRIHVEDAIEFPDVSAAVMKRATSIASRPANLITSAGTEATQTVFHLHIHIVPRKKDDGLLLPWSNQH